MDEAQRNAPDEVGVPGYGRERIEHVIVLMMENRSFDHLLGYLHHPDNNYPGLTEQSCPVDPDNPDGPSVPATDTAEAILGTDPDHAHNAVMWQMYGKLGAKPAGIAPMNGFVASYDWKIKHGSVREMGRLARAFTVAKSTVTNAVKWLMRKPKPVPAKPEEIMECFAEAKIPVLSTLAKEFAVFTHWHASVPGETWPNRNFAHAGTSDGETNIDYRFYENKTIFERLPSKHEWRVYHDGVAQVWAFPNLWRESRNRFQSMDALIAAIDGDRLPAYSFVEPNHGILRGEGNSQHPGNNLTGGDSFEAGERLMARIYNTLASEKNKRVFKKTLLLITYDEHGGFYDREPPHDVESPDNKTDKSGFAFDISGVRVPTVAISPLIQKHTIASDFYDHASIPKMISGQFAPDPTPVLAREAAANDPLDLLPLLQTPRDDYPETVGAAADERREDSVAVELPDDPYKLTDLQAGLVELAGAVKTVLEERPIARRIDPEEKPPWRPDGTLKAAAVAGEMNPAAHEELESVLAEFTADG